MQPKSKWFTCITEKKSVCFRVAEGVSKFGLCSPKKESDLLPTDEWREDIGG